MLRDYIYMSSQAASKASDKLVTLLETFLQENAAGSYGESIECELKFGTRGVKPISKIDFDNVVQRLLSSGFMIKGSTQKRMLRIQPQYVEPKTGVTRVSNVRVQLTGLNSIQKYCKTNTLPTTGVTFTRKSLLRLAKEEGQNPVDFDDFNFRVTMHKEEDLNELSKGKPIVRSTIDSWRDNKKVFRYITRTTFHHPELPFEVDMSVVKESKRHGRGLIPEYTVQESGVFEGREKYEIEIEVSTSHAGLGDVASLASGMRKVAQIALRGLQQTNYPISYPEQTRTLGEYMKLFDETYNDGQRVYPRNFIGPSPMTLQVRNIAPINPDATIPNIRSHYTVTEKADGSRKLMFINGKGHIYLIDTNMNIQFTGAMTDVMEVRNTLIDGEHILRDKKGAYINLYAGFDIYFLNKEDVRSYTFIPVMDKAEPLTEKSRLPLLVEVMKQLTPKSVVKGQLTPMRFVNKKFYAENDSQSIFAGCGMVMQQVEDGMFEYETDGLILTQGMLPVGGSHLGDKPKNFKAGWEHTFKYKEPKWNTIDFLVSTKKSKNGQDFVGSVFQNGTDASSIDQLTQYKTLELRVGFDEKKHGYVNPCAAIINDEIAQGEETGKEEGYRPVMFVPTDPYDPDAGLCNILITDDGNGDKKMFTEDREVFSDEMIVEFRYNPDKEAQWRWEPLRVRYDKTAEYRSGLKNYGNAYHVANTNWHSLHNPVTREMMATGEGIPDELGDDDIYYNRVGRSTSTRGLRDFHNLFVKNRLILSVSKPGNTLIDYAVGKGGDMSKWIAARLSFVFGIDIARDNIENRVDGACARYLNYRKRFKQMPAALYVHGNGSVNIRNTEGLYSETGKLITRAVFGEGVRDEKQLGKGVYKQFGKGKEGFNVSSIQFAIHYMFRDQETLQGLLRNVSECTRVGGYFIGTTYDGEQIFKMLKSYKKGNGKKIREDDVRIWEVVKQYDRETFEPNSSCLGYGIDVYQESINKTFREFLVNHQYLTRLMEDYGFVPLTRNEERKMHLPSGLGTFREMFGEMQNEAKREPSKREEYGAAFSMTPGEKQISFLNRYFVYKKVRDVNAEKVSLGLMNTTLQEEHVEADLAAQAESVVLEEAKAVVAKPITRRTAKTKKKLVIM